MRRCAGGVYVLRVLALRARFLAIRSHHRTKSKMQVGRAKIGNAVCLGGSQFQNVSPHVRFAKFRRSRNGSTESIFCRIFSSSVCLLRESSNVEDTIRDVEMLEASSSVRKINFLNNLKLNRCSCCWIIGDLRCILGAVLPGSTSVVSPDLKTDLLILPAWRWKQVAIVQIFANNSTFGPITVKRAVICSSGSLVLEFQSHSY